MKQDAINRKLQLCPTVEEEFEFDEKFHACDKCGHFMLWCCGCNNKRINMLERGETPPEHICHHYRIVFTDGACSNNGQAMARASVGCAVSDDDKGQKAIPVTNEMNSFKPHTSQRAEIIAAMTGLMYLSAWNSPSVDENNNEKQQNARFDPGSMNLSNPVWIVATDSEYVVKCMTEWYSSWKVCPIIHVVHCLLHKEIIANTRNLTETWMEDSR